MYKIKFYKTLFPFIRLFLFFICISPLLVNAQFHNVYHGLDTSDNIKGISFISEKEGYVAFQKFIGYTFDSGHSYTKNYIDNNVNYNGYQVNLTFGFNARGIKAFSKDTLIVYGDYGFEPSILYSINGGASWLLVYHRKLRFDATYLLEGTTDLEFPNNSSTGFAVDGEAVVKTTDRGRTWNLILSAFNQQLTKISFVNAVAGYVVGKNELLKTTDGGVSWQNLSSFPDMTDVDFVSEQTGYIFNEYGYVYKSLDGGLSFTQMNQDITSLHTNDVHFINDSTGFAAVHSYAVYKTSNSGKTWEILPGSNAYQFLGYGYNTLFFYTDNIIWAGGDGEYLSFTTNSGGKSIPSSIFTANTSSVCTNNTVQLINLSADTYTYKWFRNGNLISTSYNTSYTVSTGIDTIKLIVNNGINSDTSQKIINSAVASSFSIISKQRDSVVCSNGATVVDIFNSDPTATYTIGSFSAGFQPPVSGNGGLLTLSYGLYSGISSIDIYVIGSKNTSCGLQNDTAIHHFGVIDPFIDITATAISAFCPQLTASLQVLDSKLGWGYWADTNMLPVPGNGGTITIHAAAAAASLIQGGDSSLDSIYTFTVRARNTIYGCTTSFAYANVPIEGRRSASKFNLFGYEYFIGDTLRFNNQSVQAEKYKWVFDSAVNFNNVTAANPSNIVYTTSGQKLVKLYATSHEGCIDSSTWTIEIYHKTAIPKSFTLCNIGVSNASDTIKGLSEYINRDVYQDTSGNIYSVGGHIPFKDYYFYPSGNEGWYAAKFNKNGKIIWRLEQDTYSSDTYSNNLIAEQIIADNAGNAYIYGHASGYDTIQDSVNKFAIPPPCSFLFKVDTKGKILWVKTFYNNNSGHSFGGSLLKGKNNDLYITTEKQPDDFFFISGNILYDDTQTLDGVIVHMDLNGNVLDSKLFPAQFDFLQKGNPYLPDNYDRFPRSTYDAQGRILIYSNLDSNQISNNKIDIAPITFNLKTVQSALLKYDTSRKIIISVKPIYNTDSKGNIKGFQPMSFAIDSSGGYYAGTETYISILPNSQTDITDKPKGKIIAYDSSSNQKWLKVTEGLDPWNMLSVKGKLFILGKNYEAEGFSIQQQYYYPTESPVLPQVKKVTSIFNRGSYAAVGATGNGSLDFVLGKFNLEDGTLEAMNIFGSTKEQECGTLKKGAGDQLIFAGTGDYNLRNGIFPGDTIGMQFIMKAAIENNCELSGTLPVTLFSFTAQKQNNTTLLQWQTGNEINNLYFDVERSSNSKLFTSIGSRPALNNTSKNNYAFVDNAPSTGINYYRLKQVDKDGKFTYSNIISVDFTNNAATFAVYPNPANNSLNITLPQSNNASQVMVFDVNGEKVMSENIAGNTLSKQINISKLSAGVYSVVLIQDGKQQTMKVVKK